ncbi:MAG TPA: PrsW family glutamic-type intramembrane protease [Gemmatimonadota bacterium]
MPILSENLQPFLIVTAIAFVYLAILRAVDLNEREPLWSLILLLWCGATGAALVRLLVNSPVLTLRPVRAALIEETATLAAVGVGFAVLAAVGRWKGWSEVTDVMDGLVYGAAAGLGFALVDTMWDLIGRPVGALAAVRPGAFATLWTAALGGLAHGIFGALIGIGCVASVLHRSAAESIGRALLGWALAVAAHVGYEVLAHGAALSGSTAVLRLWVALAMPLALVVLLALRSLFGERRAIRAELDEEAGIGGTPGPASGYLARRRAALAALLRGDLRAHAAEKALHNRRVQLALARWRERRTDDPARQARARAEVESLRAAVRRLQEEAP